MSTITHETDALADLSPEDRDTVREAVERALLLRVQLLFSDRGDELRVDRVAAAGQLVSAFGYLGETGFPEPPRVTSLEVILDALRKFADWNADAIENLPLTGHTDRFYEERRRLAERAIAIVETAR